MPFNLGLPELIVVLVIVLLLFGPKKLPDFARSMGQAIREFRHASQEMMDDIQRSASEEPKGERVARGEGAHAYDSTGGDAEAHPVEPPTTKQL